MVSLQLTVPSTHTLLELESSGEIHAPPITGSIAIAVPSPNVDASIVIENDPKITIRLIRSVTPRAHDLVIPSNNQSKSHGWFFKRKQKHRPTTNRIYPTVEPGDETLVQCDLWHSLDEVDSEGIENEVWRRFNFCIPIPNNVPASADTILGNVSYAITATATFSTPSSSRILRDKQAIRIMRRVISEPIQYVRQYPGERVSTGLCLTPNQQQQQGFPERTKVAFSSQWVAHSTIAQGPRPTEVKYIVAKELKWRVEETVKYITISTDSGLPRSAITTTCKEQHVRQLCDGSRKGHWIASGELHAGDHSIEVPFDISIPLEAQAADGFSLSSYLCQHQPKACEFAPRETTAITVDHHLRLEVITGEDTFDQKSGKLVDRKPRVKSFIAVFPLFVRDFVRGGDITLSEFRAGDTLPRYEDPYPIPPNYATAR